MSDKSTLEEIGSVCKLDTYELMKTLEEPECHEELQGKLRCRKRDKVFGIPFLFTILKNTGK